jgi:N-acetyltransferase 10
MKSKEEAPLPPELLQRYAIEDGGSDFESVLQNNGGKIPTSGLIAVKSSRTGVELEKEKSSHKRGTKRGKDNKCHKISKRRS